MATSDRKGATEEFYWITDNVTSIKLYAGAYGVEKIEAASEYDKSGMLGCSENELKEEIKLPINLETISVRVYLDIDGAFFP